jgi:hypothetical protein
MDFGDDTKATISVAADLAPGIESALRDQGLLFQPAGAARGAADAAVLITVAVPSIVTLALLAEKLRRLNLPRTYIYPGPDGPDIRVDEEIHDGRVVVVRSDESVEELLDKEISAAALQEALRPPQSPGA